MLTKIKRQFFAGLVIFVPIALTVYFSRLLFLLVSAAMHPLLLHQQIVPIPPIVVRPLAFFLTLFLIWALGVFASNFIGRRLVTWMDWVIHQVPVFRGLYEAIQKITEALFGSKNIYQSAVMVQYPRLGTYTIGFVTSEMPGAVFGQTEPYYCVFIPTVPNPTSGLLLYIPRSQTLALHMSIEEVVKIIVSHGFVPIPASAVTQHPEVPHV
jgi:uncharacterized membrane protein